MDESILYDKLKNPSIYGSSVKSVKILQTHISYVVLTGDYAYKIKKPVNFVFLDFSSLEKRRHFCEEEIRLNKRLCPEIYLGVIPITKKDQSIEIDGCGEIIEYAVKMKEFSQENIMTKMLQQGKIDEVTIDKIVDILIKFYKTGERSIDIDIFGSIDTIKSNTDENFEQTESVIDITIPQNVFNFIKLNTTKFLKSKKNIFNKRIENGFIKDCHGDLHTGNIVVTKDDIFIFDCIEFNTRFRYSDVASDICFLAMDLDFLGYPYHSSFLIDKYVEKSGDTEIFNVLNFYKCYRAYVRGKVTGFKLNDPNIDDFKKNVIITTARKYFDLAYYYAQLFSLDLIEEKRPILFITTGLSGTGKTTAASKMSIDYHADLISTDTVRKELKGIDKYERHHDAYNTGLYAPDKMQETYEIIIERAKDLLIKGYNVVLDATFKTEELRNKAEDITKETNTRFLIIYTKCPESVVKKYLEQRVKKKSISDGRWEIYVKQKDSFEKIKNKPFVELDISNNSYDYQIKVFRSILNKIINGEIHDN